MKKAPIASIAAVAIGLAGAPVAGAAPDPHMPLPPIW
jgi:hypothetical protein